MAKKQILITVLIAILMNGCSAEMKVKDAINLIKLPEGFKIEVYADNVQGARSMTKGELGTIFVGSRDSGNVYAIIDKDKDQKGETVKIIASGLKQPNGVAIHMGNLYVAEISRILCYYDIEKHLDDEIKPTVIYDNFPKDEHHGWKYIAFGPDEKLYVPVGVPCNICDEKDEIYGTITRMNADGTDFEIFAKGIRNTVGFDWHPKTKDLWFTENGRDWMGDDIPPDELCKAPKAEMHFGFPYCHGKNILDPAFGKGHSCNEFTEPELELGPHVAALGMKFYTGKMFPAKYKGQIFIAEHGSWNRSKPIGYRIMMVTLKDGYATEYNVFAQGWLQEEKAWGRPVDVLIMEDGAMLISDDKAGVIYRIYYQK
ncbi:MAG: sorbosone dehydrogenase [Planctomycetes bacterium GWF2_42_9]|nr:MAG: sorbosone dehydrogenase [Planctomycetes bacterium GWF2_42_9]